MWAVELSYSGHDCGWVHATHPYHGRMNWFFTRTGGRMFGFLGKYLTLDEALVKAHAYCDEANAAISAAEQLSHATAEAFSDSTDG